MCIWESLFFGDLLEASWPFANPSASGSFGGKRFQQLEGPWVQPDCRRHVPYLPAMPRNMPNAKEVGFDGISPFSLRKAGEKVVLGRGKSCCSKLGYPSRKLAYPTKRERDNYQLSAQKCRLVGDMLVPYSILGWEMVGVL